jgi:hypothetical protein
VLLEPRKLFVVDVLPEAPRHTTRSPFRGRAAFLRTMSSTVHPSLFKRIEFEAR